MYDIEVATIRRIGPTSAARIGAALGLVIGVLYIPLFMLFGQPFLFPLMYPPPGSQGVSVLVLLALFLVGAAIGGALSLLVSAWIYNLAFSLVGGLQVTIEHERYDGPTRKRKSLVVEPERLSDLMP